MSKKKFGEKTTKPQNTVIKRLLTLITESCLNIKVPDSVLFVIFTNDDHKLTKKEIEVVKSFWKLNQEKIQNQFNKRIKLYCAINYKMTHFNPDFANYDPMFDVLFIDYSN